VPGQDRPQQPGRLAAGLEVLELAEQAVGGVGGADAGRAHRPDGLDDQLDPVGVDAQPGRDGAGRTVQEPAVVQVCQDVGGQPAVAVGQQRDHLSQQRLGGALGLGGRRPGIAPILGRGAGPARQPVAAGGAAGVGDPGAAAWAGRPVDPLEGGVAGQLPLDQLLQVGQGQGQQLDRGDQGRRDPQVEPRGQVERGAGCHRSSTRRRVPVPESGPAAGAPASHSFLAPPPALPRPGRRFQAPLFVGHAIV
jgi:hypothetical protein